MLAWSLSRQQGGECSADKVLRGKPTGPWLLQDASQAHNSAAAAGRRLLDLIQDCYASALQRQSAQHHFSSSGQPGSSRLFSTLAVDPPAAVLHPSKADQPEPGLHPSPSGQSLARSQLVRVERRLCVCLAPLVASLHMCWQSVAHGA